MKLKSERTVVVHFPATSDEKSWLLMAVHDESKATWNAVQRSAHFCQTTRMTSRCLSRASRVTSLSAHPPLSLSPPSSTLRHATLPECLTASLLSQSLICSYYSLIEQALGQLSASNALATTEISTVAHFFQSVSIISTLRKSWSSVHSHGCLACPSMFQLF